MMHSSLLKELSIDCEKCSGLCCVALYCSKIDGFPENKSADTPCKHLESNFKCNIHTQLLKKNMKGCLIYECFGAGQKVTQLYKSVGNWSSNPGQRKEIYQIFLIMTKLYQMRWYLIQAFDLNVSLEINDKITALIQENEQLAGLHPNKLLSYNLDKYREKTNHILKIIIDQISAPQTEKSKNYLGMNFRGKNLNGKDFSMSLLIATNLEHCSLKKAIFLGANMRDANVKNTDLSQSLFLTQMQINSAKGNSATKLPLYLSRPSSWN